MVRCHDGLAYGVGGAIRTYLIVQCHDDLANDVGGATRTYLMVQCHGGLSNGVGGATRTYVSHGAVPRWLSSRCRRCHTASLRAPVGSSSSATR